MKTELILLAAGQSKRFGGIKQLADIHGRPMICHCLAQYYLDGKWIEGIAGGLIALGANAEVIIDVLPVNINKQVIDTWSQGMGHTLSESMKVIASDTTHVLIGLADQVLITQHMIMGMLRESKKHPQNIIAAKYAGRVGVPCIFPRQYFSQLGQLSGDKGAKALLQQYLPNVITMATPKAEFDIDTLEDLSVLGFGYQVK